MKEFILFYDKFCPHCISFEPTWNRFYDSNNGNYHGIVLRSYEHNAEPDIIQLHKIPGFPTMRFFPEGQHKYEYFDKYNRARTINDIIAFLDDMLVKYE